jgi:ATP-binding protein involved in chromosome partitioning
MVVSEGQVGDAVASVIHPTLRRPLGDLGLVRRIRVDGGRVEVLAAVLQEDDPDADELVARIREAVGRLEGVQEVAVPLTILPAEEQTALGSRLRDEQGGAAGPGTKSEPGQRLGHEEGRPNAFSAPSSRTRVLGITSGKGGVGKSSVTVNLAISLAKMGKEVGVLDADVYGFSVPKMLGIERDPVVIGDLMVPPVAFGVRCMSIGFFVEEDQPIMWRGPMLHKALEQFLADVYWGDLDYLLIDMPPGTGDVALSMAQYLPASEVYVVTTPQPAARRVAQRTATMARKINLPLRGVIENMSWFTGNDGTRYQLFGEGGGEELATDLKVPLLGQVPLVPALRQGGDDGYPVTVSDPGSEAAAAFESLAKAVDALGPARIRRAELRIS